MASVGGDEARVENPFLPDRMGTIPFLPSCLLFSFGFELDAVYNRRYGDENPTCAPHNHSRDIDIPTTRRKESFTLPLNSTSQRFAAQPRIDWKILATLWSAGFIVLECISGANLIYRVTVCAVRLLPQHQNGSEFGGLNQGWSGHATSTTCTRHEQRFWGARRPTEFGDFNTGQSGRVVEK
ncbi:hypothetical protein B0H14DRAFT_3155921 [Mycena olivaceomarginata]|nr:hypothetical protein B0H14DRAFT_3155921 [Mycena olivaceomarginata]